MVGTYQEEAWLKVKLSSTSLRDVKLTMVDMFINPEYNSFIQKVEKIDLLNNEDPIVLKNGE